MGGACNMYGCGEKRVQDFLILILIYLSTSIVLTHGGSTHLHINNT
jgi:hypothetical protein